MNRRYGAQPYFCRDKMRRFSFSACLLSAVLVFAGNAPVFAQAQARAAAAASDKHKVVFQVSDSDPGKWELTLNNIRNLQKDVGNNKLDIEVVAFGPGIAMLKRESSVGTRVQETLATGVKVVACENTMRGMRLNKDDMLTNIGYVPTGVFEVMKKQEEGYSYLRP